MNQHSDLFNTGAKAGAASCMFVSFLHLHEWFFSLRDDYATHFLANDAGCEALLLQASLTASSWGKDVFEKEKDDRPDRFVYLDELQNWVSGNADRCERDGGCKALRHLFEQVEVQLLHQGLLQAGLQKMEEIWAELLSQQSQNAQKQLATLTAFVVLTNQKAFSILLLPKSGVLLQYDSHRYDSEHLSQSSAFLAKSVKDLLPHLKLSQLIGTFPC